MATQGKYAVVDTTLSITDSTPIPGLNGRQGDNGRIVYFALKDGRLPHNLDGQDVALEVKDAAGKIKVVNGIYDMISATAGLFSMLIPAEVYQAAGDVEEAYLAVTDVNNTVISTIPITFTVFANGIILSANASQDYIDTVQKFLDDFEQQISTVSGNLGGIQTAVSSLNDAITNYTDLVNTQAAAIKTSTNEFTESQTIDKDLTVKGSIHGKADNAIQADSANNLATTAILDNSMKSHTTSITAFGGTLNFMRIGNVVSVYGGYDKDVANYQFNKYSIFYPAGTVPAGYRPSINNYDVWYDSDGGTAYQREPGPLAFMPDGSIGSRNAWTHDDSKIFMSISGTYVTSDDMPS